MLDNPCYRNSPRENSTGSGSAYGVAYRFGFFLEADGPLASEALYYRIMIGNPDDDILLAEVSCKIEASLFTTGTTIRIYKYASGPIVIFSGDIIIGIIKDGDSGDVLWGTTVTYLETISSAISSENRDAYLADGNTELRSLVYIAEVDTTTHSLVKLQRRESPSFPDIGYQNGEYSLLFLEGDLFLRVPSVFKINDYRIPVKTEGATGGADENVGLVYDVDRPYEQNPFEITVKTTTVEEETFVFPDAQLTVEPEILSGEYINCTITDSKVVAPFCVCVVPETHYYKTPIEGLGVNTQFVLYAVVEPKPNEDDDSELVMTVDFDVEIKHVIGWRANIPEETTGYIHVPLCSVFKEGDFYFIVAHNHYGVDLKSNGLLLRKVDEVSVFPYRDYDPWAFIVNAAVEADPLAEPPIEAVASATTIKNIGLYGADSGWLSAADLVVTGAGYVYGKLVTSQTGSQVFTAEFTTTEADTKCTPAELEEGTVKVLAYQVGFDGNNEAYIIKDYIHSGIYIDRAGWEEKQVTVFTKDKTITAKIKVLTSEDTEVLNEVAHAGSEGQVLGLDDGGNLGFINQTGAGADFDVISSVESIEVTSEGLVFTFNMTNTITGTAGDPATTTKTVALVEKTLVDDVNYAGTAFTKNKTSIKGFAASAADSENESIVSLVSHASQHPE